MGHIEKEIREGTNEVKEDKIDLLQAELEYFVMNDEKIVMQMYDRLIVPSHFPHNYLVVPIFHPNSLQ